VLDEFSKACEDNADAVVLVDRVECESWTILVVRELVRDSTEEMSDVLRGCVLELLGRVREEREVANDLLYRFGRGLPDRSFWCGIRRVT
jgi:hypothetical protein